MAEARRVVPRRLRRLGALLVPALAAATMSAQVAVAESSDAGAAAGGRPQPVDVNRAGQLSDGSRLYAMSVTPDGRYALVGSDASNMPGVSSSDPSYEFYLYRRDLRSGTTVQVTGCPTWASPAPSYTGRTMTPDGRYVAFTSPFGCSPDGSSAFTDQVYVHDMVTGQTRAASQTSDGRNAAHGVSEHPTISDDGRFVAYESTATNLHVGKGGNTGPHVYVHDMLTGANRLVDHDPDGSTPNIKSAQARGGDALSADGSRVVYYTYNPETGRYLDRFQDLTSGTDELIGNVGGTSRISRDGRYVAQAERQPGQVVSQGSLLNLATGQRQPSSLPAPGSTYRTCSLANISPSNRYLVYSCYGPRTNPDDPYSGTPALFRRDLTTDSVTRVDTLPSTNVVEPNGPGVGGITTSGAVLFASAYRGFAPADSPAGDHAYLSPPAP